MHVCVCVCVPVVDVWRLREDGSGARSEVAEAAAI